MIFPDGALWKEQRRFVGRSLKMLGGDLGEGMEVRAFSFPFIYFCFGRRGFSSFSLFFLEVRVVAEAREVVKHLEGLLGGEDEVLVKMDDFFDLPCLNVMWSLVASGRKMTFLYN